MTIKWTWSYRLVKQQVKFKLKQEKFYKLKKQKFKSNQNQYHATEHLSFAF